MSDPARLEALRAKLQAREGVPGYEQNVEALKAEIARLEAEPEPEEGEDDAA